MKNLPLLITVIASLLCAGCLIVPQEVPEDTFVFSRKAEIKKEMLEFVEVGATTREEVLLNLGDPNCAFYPEWGYRCKDRLWTYSWKKYAPGTRWYLVGQYGSEVISEPPIIRYKLHIEFDENGIVTGYEFEESEEKKKD